MVTRRKFLGSLAGLTALTALAGAGIRLPKRTEVEVDNRLIDGWSFETHPDWTGPWSNNHASGVQLTEQSLQDILNQMKDSEMLRSSPGYLARPNKLIVPPRLEKRAREILEYSSLNFFDRLLWRLAHL